VRPLRGRGGQAGARRGPGAKGGRGGEGLLQPLLLPSGPSDPPPHLALAFITARHLRAIARQPLSTPAPGAPLQVPLLPGVPAGLRGQRPRRQVLAAQGLLRPAAAASG
jgi:hypothetical protein